MRITIEKGIELPSVKTSTVYPWAKTEVGDSFIAGRYSREKMQSLSGAISYQKKAHDRHFALRKTEDGKIRVFRIK